MLNNELELQQDSDLNTLDQEQSKVEVLLLKLIELNKNIVLVQKHFNSSLKIVLKLHNKKCKELRKQNTKNRVRNINNEIKRKPSGFAKPTKISKKLAKFMGVSSKILLARTVVTKKVTQYIKNKNLQVETNRRQFKPDKKLQSILSPLDNIKVDKNGLTDVQKGYTYFNLQKYLSSQFPK
jgi:chromatin remodeling complex protein RSC6